MMRSDIKKDLRRLSKNKTSNFQHCAILFIHLC